jgi:hypothetical protein
MLLFIIYIICVIYMMNIYGVDAVNRFLFDLLLIFDMLCDMIL